jgi:hypothetical protein
LAFIDGVAGRPLGSAPMLGREHLQPIASEAALRSASYVCAIPIRRASLNPAVRFGIDGRRLHGDMRKRSSPLVIIYRAIGPKRGRAGN